jgi:hypothetical protein
MAGAGSPAPANLEVRMVRDQVGITGAERIGRIEQEIQDMKKRLERLELHWAYATGIIVAVMVVLKFI